MTFSFLATEINIFDTDDLYMLFNRKLTLIVLKLSSKNCHMQLSFDALLKQDVPT